MPCEHLDEYGGKTANINVQNCRFIITVMATVKWHILSSQGHGHNKNCVMCIISMASEVMKLIN